jgi:dolichyl-phosphate beta-glucosyltransferase
MGRLFNTLVQAFELSGFPDTQCGFKVFRRSVAQDLFSSQTIRGWGFDVEILVIARQRGYTVASTPINWTHDADSRVRPIRDGLTMLLEVWAIRNRWKNGGYSTPPRRQPIVEPVVSNRLPHSEVHDIAASFRRSK